MKNRLITGIYNLKQLFIATMLGGPIVAGSVIAFNIWAQKQRLKASLAFILGFFLEIILIFIAYMISVHYLDLLPGKMKILEALSLIIMLNCTIAYYSRFYFQRKIKLNEFLFPVINQELHHQRKSYPLFIISVLSFFTVIAIPPYFIPVLLLYLLPHFYGYILISKTFFNSKIVKYIKALIVLLACFLPLVFTIHWLLRKQTLFSEYLYYYLAIYNVALLYLLLIIGSFEILKLLNKLFIKLTSFEKLQRKPVVLVLILFSIITASGFTFYGYYVNNKPVINKYSITLPRKTSKLDDLKVICVADIHLKNLTSNLFLERLVGKIKETQPDLLVLPGDLIEAYDNTMKEEKLKKFQELFKEIKPRYGIYSSPGNHDNFAMEQFYKNTNIICLPDSVTEIEDKILLIGLKYRDNHEIRLLDSLLNYNTKNLPVILLDHVPYCLDNSVKNNIDIQFSGHTHNGQLWPFNYLAEAVYDLSWGYKKIKNTHFFVTCGVQDGFLPAPQNISLPIRTGSVSEIMEVDIKFK
jgi:uncharacterized protein